MASIFTDRDIAEQLQSGDIGALETVYRWYCDRLYAYVFSLVRSKEVAEDILANGYLSLYRYASSGHRIDNLKAFLYAACRNASYDALNAKKRWKALNDDVSHTEETVDVEATVMLRQALLKLPLQEREIVSMHCYAGFKHREIADLLEIPEGTVRWKYRLALRKLKSDIGSDEDGR